MTRQEKEQFIGDLTEKLEQTAHFYLTDISGLTVSESNKLRRLCFNKGVELKVVKNTLLKKAMERAEGNFDESYEFLKGNTALFFSESGSLPAKLIMDFRKKSDRPILKAAFVEETFYFGDDQLSLLSLIKSKTELIGDVIGLLQSPIKNVISGLKSAGSDLSGILKALAERPEQPAATAEATPETKPEEVAKEEQTDDKPVETSESPEATVVESTEDESSKAVAEDEPAEEAASQEAEAESTEVPAADDTAKVEGDSQVSEDDASTDNSDGEGETSDEESEPENENK